MTIAWAADIDLAGRRYWILIWYGFLVAGLLGLAAAVYWGRRTSGRNLDEILRALATISIAVGALVILRGGSVAAGGACVALALVLFVVAFRVGRPPRGPRRMH